MKIKMKIILASALSVVLAGSGIIALSSGSSQVLAATDAPSATSVPKDKPAKPKPRAGGQGGQGGPAPDSNHDGIDCPEQGQGEAVLPSSSASSATSNGEASSEVTNPSTYSVVIRGGLNTDPQDKGRPVVLIAAALGVPTEVFREAFSGVTPSGLDSQPSHELAQRNKAALMKVLSPYGITNERLDEVSNFYRYNGNRTATWQKTPATATAIVTDGVVTGVTITNPGAGYSSTPTVTITGPTGTVTAKAVVTNTQDFKTNGSITSITLD
ncbi:hypothetical protein [Paenibacillus oryzisoli]|uniref:Uncharacterized protein n=1 Tax=Paenibacillus oryzisoli TaxID=1850517 RepID=A0A198AE02_9BACL|nr:hypothetical protein [Paenibacillus oryzisoli]OAS19729.1 hypothetical protein A8708_26255 [Paenibacillus oryzisoli]